MKKLLILPILALAACSDQRGVHGDWATGAEFGPSTKVEFLARAARGEPGVFPAPSGYSVFTDRQRAATGAAPANTVPRQGTASSRTGEFITNGTLTPAQARAQAQGAPVQGVQVAATARAPSTDLRNSPYRNGALSAANRATIFKQEKVNLNGTNLRLNVVERRGISYAVFRSGTVYSGALDRGLDATMQAALPGLTGCSNAAGPFLIGPGGRSNTHMVYALSC